MCSPWWLLVRRCDLHLPPPGFLHFSTSFRTQFALGLAPLLAWRHVSVCSVALDPSSGFSFSVFGACRGRGWPCGLVVLRIPGLSSPSGSARCLYLVLPLAPSKSPPSYHVLGRRLRFLTCGSYQVIGFFFFTLRLALWRYLIYTCRYYYKIPPKGPPVPPSHSWALSLNSVILGKLNIFTMVMPSLPFIYFFLPF